MSSLEKDSQYLKKSSLISILGTVLKVCGPLITLLLAKIFGSAEFGIYVSTQALLLTLSHSATLGLDKGLYWYLPKNSASARPAHYGIMESFWIAAAISLLCTAVIFAGSFLSFFSSELPWYAVSIAPYAGIFIFGCASEGNRHPQYAIYINSFLVAILAPAASIVLHFLHIAHALPLGLFVGQMTGFLLHFTLIRKQFPQMPIFPRVRISKELFAYSLPLGFNEFASSFLIRSSLWMVMLFLGPEYAGAYAIMVTISNGLQTVRAGYTPILTPVIAGMSKDRLATDLKPAVSYCIFMITTIQLFIGFFIILFPAEILSFVGKDYSVQPMALGVLLFVQLLLGFFGMAFVIMNGIGRSLYVLKMNLLSLAVSGIFGCILIPRFGLVGAALSTLTYNLVQMIWNNVLLAREKLWPYARSLWNQIFWMIAMFALYAFLNFSGISLGLFPRAAIYIFILALVCIHFWIQRKACFGSR